MDYSNAAPAYDPPQDDGGRSYPQPSATTTPTRPLLRSKRSLLDEIIPLPTSSASKPQARFSLSHPFIPLVRRTGSLAIIAIFLLSISFMATQSGGHHSRTGLRTIFGVGSNAGLGGTEWVAQDLGEISGDGGGMVGEQNGQVDFERYVKMRTIPPADVDMEVDGRRVIFIGDIHGSFQPLQRLLTRLNFNMETDRVVHVGDLVAKGSRNIEVLEWMHTFNIQGVRGNHDQPVIQWRAWMEWAGGEEWEQYIDNLDDGGEGGRMKILGSEGKMFPKGWEWRGEHWKIARYMQGYHYEYLVNLPLALHIPSLHTFVVHAGLLPYDPSKSAKDKSQPLVAAADSTFSNAAGLRMTEELSILLDIPQNTDPYTLINMRSVHLKGKKKGQVTKSSKKGKPWSDVWKKAMGKCRGPGSSYDEEDDEVHGNKESAALESLEDLDTAGTGAGKSDDDDDDDGGDDEVDDEKVMECSPVTVIYGHAAGRGLDIKPFSKGIDTGCVYGRKLTALVIGNTHGIGGKSTRVGGTKGVIVSIDCGEGGQ